MMGKRNVVVSSSSDSEYENPCRSLSSNKSKSKSRSSTTRSSSSKRPRRLSTSRSLRPKESPHRLADEVNFDGFLEGFYEEGFGEALGSLKSDKELWVDKYEPQSLEELAVHKKKVEEVRTWIVERLMISKEEFQNRALVITGQSGVGKSTTVRTITSHLGVKLCEWDTPTPTLWQEHIHNSSSGVSYMSKLDEFEAFVERIRKYSLLPLSSSGEPKEPYICLIDDLPLANGKVAYGRLSKCLHILAQSTRTPTIILISQYSKLETPENTTRHWEDLQSCLETVGAHKVAFNPITVNSVKKTLSRICKQENCNITNEQIDLLAKASGGDIRYAITSLQYVSLRASQRLTLSISTPIGTSSNGKPEEFTPSDDGSVLPFGRDETLSLFHALGKFLHNKRENLKASGLGEDSFLLRESFTRLPLKMDTPEKVIHQAHGQARSITDFLHENVLDFISDEAIDAAWAVSSYLSDADYLLATFPGSGLSRTMNGHHGQEKISELAASSVAVRGVLYGNSHPSASRWHTIRSPKLWLVDQSSKRNKIKMLQQRIEADSSLRSSDLSVTATEYRPVFKWLGLRASEVVEVDENGWSNNRRQEDNSNPEGTNDVEEKTSQENEDDEIEDW